ncbi:MAG: DUF6790 family protein [Methyloceanibacter sp.]
MDADVQIWVMPVAVWIAAQAAAGVAIWRGPRPIPRDYVIDQLLRYIFFFPLGVQSLWAFFGHVFFPEQAAAVIGWKPSPFQYEIGVANLGLGLASIYAAFRGFQERVTVAVFAASLLIGAGIGHIRDILQAGNFAPGNAGPIMITDFLTPLAIVVLLFLAARKPKSPAAVALDHELKVARKALDEYRAALENFGKD